MGHLYLNSENTKEGKAEKEEMLSPFFNMHIN